jgi:hypothetical protein
MLWIAEVPLHTVFSLVQPVVLFSPTPSRRRSCALLEAESAPPPPAFRLSFGDEGAWLDGGLATCVLEAARGHHDLAKSPFAFVLCGCLARVGLPVDHFLPFINYASLMVGGVPCWLGLPVEADLDRLATSARNATHFTVFADCTPF